ncbi:Terminase small subunit (plasmid) [Gemmatirosa kalamazoonensis]|uniref:Terminase small subunit n=1 Tax=Gemmatirosa kalamazoonensis TaxID=861299 RepID=W0RNS3_9BACT|nr:terminase small subunit [Gemmatirosa kalamazoonensis]AHG92142.1 Terminase small subunit [Gemmatirosa kalamazoonensis]
MTSDAPALTPKQQRFVEEFIVDLNATQAAIRAGYSARVAANIGYENLQKPQIAAAIREAKAARSLRTQIEADDVLQRWWDLANANPNELVEVAAPLVPLLPRPRRDVPAHRRGAAARSREV